MRRPAQMRHQQGFALVLVLWVLSLLTIMSGSFALSMRREASIVAGIKDASKASALVESGIAIAQTMLLLPGQNDRWLADGGIYQINTVDAFTGTGGTGGKIRIRMFAETGKIDLNKANQKLLESLFKASPLADDEKQQARLVAAIMDWRDPDDNTQPEGAEKNDYQDAHLSYQPTNKPFQSLEEVRLVKGMDMATYKWLLPLVTIYSGQAQVNAQQATRDVLAVLPDADLDMVDDYIKGRTESTLKGTPLPQAPTNTKNGPLGENEVVTVICEALMDDGASAVISSLIKAGGNAKQPFQILKWQTYTTQSGSLFAEANNDLVLKEYAEFEFNH